MLTLDIRTLFVCLLLLNLLVSGVMLIYWRTQRTYPGFGWWTAGFGLLALAWLFYSLRGIAPDSITVVGANGLPIVTTLLFLEGIERFLGMPDKHRLRRLAPVGGFLALAVFGYSPMARVVIIALGVSFLDFWVIRALLVHGGREARQLYTLLAVLFIGQAASLLGRLVVWLLVPAERSLLIASVPNTIYQLMAIVLEVGIASSLIALTNTRLRDQAETALRALHAAERRKREELTGLVEARTVELTALNAELERQVAERNQAAGALRRLNEELEERVAGRTAELEAANRELEAFSYSVSHDLRAPLRAIDGYLAILVEGCGSRLDGEENRLLEIARSNARHMGCLVDDLLEFARARRQGIELGRTDMEQLVADAFAQVKQTFPTNCTVRLEVKPLPPAEADPVMLRQVLINLLANAVKFSLPKGEVRIEVGASSADGENVYYVRDHGVGFDMDYVHKLFGVFHRLHSLDEFEGTGIGLAVVKRIIERHNGRVWAEGKVGEGATFHFALPAP